MTESLTETRDPDLLSNLISQRLAVLAPQQKMTLTITNTLNNTAQTYTEYDPFTKLTVLFRSYFKGFLHTPQNDHIRFDMRVSGTDVIYKRVVLPLESIWDCDVTLCEIGLLDSDQLLIYNMVTVPVDDFKEEFPKGELADARAASYQEVEQPEMMDVDEPEKEEVEGEQQDEEEEQESSEPIVKQEPASQNSFEIPEGVRIGDDGITRNDPIVLEDESQESHSTSIELPPGNQKQDSIPVPHAITPPTATVAETPSKQKTPDTVAPTRTTTTSTAATHPTSAKPSPFKHPDSSTKTKPIKTKEPTKLPVSQPHCTIKIKPNAPYRAHSFRIKQDSLLEKLIDMFKEKLPRHGDVSAYDVTLFIDGRELDPAETPKSLGFKDPSAILVLKATVLAKVLFKIEPVGFFGPTINYKVTRSKPLSKTFRRYRKYLEHLDKAGELQFWHNGELVDPRLTADAIGLRDSEIVEVRIV